MLQLSVSEGLQVNARPLEEAATTTKKRKIHQNFVRIVSFYESDLGDK